VARAKVAEPELEEEVEAEEGGGFRSQMWKHEAMVEWLNEQVGEDINDYSAAQIIALAFAQRVSWRKSDEYQELISEYKASRPAPAKKTKKVAESNGADEEEDEEEEEEETPAPRARKRTTKAAATSTKAAPQKAVRKTTKSSGENPFD
jgi:hypothetical protein